jgi:hypothetical protein
VIHDEKLTPAAAAGFVTGIVGELDVCTGWWR